MFWTVTKSTGISNKSGVQTCGSSHCNFQIRLQRVSKNQSCEMRAAKSGLLHSRLTMVSSPISQRVGTRIAITSRLGMNFTCGTSVLLCVKTVYTLILSSWYIPRFVSYVFYLSCWHLKSVTSAPIWPGGGVRVDLLPSKQFFAFGEPPLRTGLLHLLSEGFSDGFLALRCAL